MKYFIVLVSAIIALTCCAGHPATTEFRLSNGLEVIVIPIKKAELISIVSLFSIGESGDPQGKSGMAHLIEHLYITSSAGEFRSRDIDHFMAEYPKGWNAQTGLDYTVIATVFPRGKLDHELRMAAARMRSVDITDSDLEREVPRIEKELYNMYEGIPMIAAQNLSAAMLFEVPLKGRKGGVIEQLRTITVGELRARMNTYYKPINARIIISGGVEPERIRARVDELFSSVTSGETLRADTVNPLPRRERPLIREVRPSFPNAASCVAVSFRAPSPADPLYAAFLVLVRRLQLNAQALKLSSNNLPVFFAALDRPEVVSLVLSVEDRMAAETVLDRLEKYVGEMRTRQLDGEEVKAAEEYFRFVFRRETYPDAVLARDPYGIAFATGRKEQMGIIDDSLIKRIGAVTNEDLAAAGGFFAPEKSAAAIIKIDK